MEKKEKIIRAAIRLFSENGFSGTPTSKIAREAEVSNGTLFHYFPTKDDLITSCFHLVQNKLVKNSEKLIEDQTDIKIIIKTIWFNSIVWSLGNYEEFLFTQKFRHSEFYAANVMENEAVKKYVELADMGKKIGVFKSLPSFFIYDLVTSQAVSTVYYLKDNPKLISDEEFLDSLFSAVWDAIRII